MAGPERKDLNLFAGQGIAVEEVHMKTDHGRVDYLLYVDKKVVGVIEAKPMGTPLAGVQWQSAVYVNGLPSEVRLAAKTKGGRLPFVFEASGTETYYTNGFDRLGGEVAGASQRTESLRRSLLAAAFSGELVA